ncbi:hypothetical protein VTI74DRAFT_5855 [Chaetomium olivicolor]
MDDDDEGWGDFEVASPAPLSPQRAAPSTNVDQPRARVTRAPTLDLMANKLVDIGFGSSEPEPWQHRPSWEQKAKTPNPPKPVRNPDPNVLFDADFEADNAGIDDDDFGDFETGTPAPAGKSAPDLLSLDSAHPPSKKLRPGLVLSNAALLANPTSYPEAPKSPYGSFHERKPETVKQLQVKPPAVTKVLKETAEASPSPITAWPTIEDDGFGNQWAEFKDLPDTSKTAVAKPGPKLISKTKAQPVPSPTLAATTEWDWQDWSEPKSHPTTSTTRPPLPTSPPTDIGVDDKPGPPPTNIPPPAILLSLFPSLLDLASSSLLKPLLTLPHSSQGYQRVLASPSTLTFLKGYLSLATVAARLIAGRKYRWHRDKFLAQGMSISAAPSVSQRGMKLTSVDKQQAAHEDREAAEVAGLWKTHVGRLRGLVAAVNAAHQGKGANLRVPEIGMSMNVSTAKGVPTAPKACVVCGLKRDERVAKVDVEVEDSFGEWWVEFWGHRECRNFWVRHEKELRSR